jgi:TRAP-type C4-dicarboxylate transport system permease small subunit
VTTQPTRLEHFCDRIASGVERVLALALILGILLNFINGMGRYLTGFTLSGADEIEIYILIWIAFLGAAVVTWRRQHLRMDVLVNACPAPVRKAVVVFEALVLLAVALFVFWQSLQYVKRLFDFGSVSDIARVPTWIPHSAVFVCFGAIAIIVVVQGVRMLTGHEPPPEPALESLAAQSVEPLGESDR